MSTLIGINYLLVYQIFYQSSRINLKHLFTVCLMMYQNGQLNCEKNFS